MKNIAIIYHDADFDGKLSNEVCRFHLTRLFPNATIHSYGWDYGRPLPKTEGTWNHEGIEMPGDVPTYSHDWAAYDAIYIVDLSVDELMAQPELRDKIIWIDHHKSAIEKWVNQGDKKYGFQFKGYRIDGVAACRLCWQWFCADGRGSETLPGKDSYTNRQVREPELIRLAGEYDVWDHRDSDAKALQFGLRALSEEELEVLIESEFAGYGAAPVLAAISNGYAIKSYCDKQNDEYSSAYARTLRWEGLTFCALNLGKRGNSDLLRGGLKPEHEAGFAWRHTGDGVMVSLYHVSDHEHRDLSEIAKKYGGGGHRGACGFSISLRQLADILGE